MDSILNVGIRLGDCAAKRLVYVCDFEENVSSNQEMLNRCLGSCPKNYCSSYKLGKEVAAKLEAVTKLTSQVHFEVVADKLPRAPTTLLELWRCLGSDSMGTIGLYGMGGIKRCRCNKSLQIPEDVWINNKVEERAIEIYKILRSKKFVLLLDDEVCGHMEANRSIKVGCLEQDKAFDLFLEKVGQESLNSHPEIPHLAKVVAEECKGLPLALISIGHSMASRKKLEDWERAIELLRSYPSKFSGIVDYVYHLLEFSYDSLPNATLQSSQRDLILEKMNLLIFGSKREFVNIHDVIRDVALWLACESGEKKNKFLVRDQTEVIFCPKLITLLIRSTLLGSFPFELFEAMCHRLTIRVGKLENLQYLDLPRTDLRALPIAMKNPKKLKCLLLNDTYNLIDIRSEVISSLSSLQVSSILQMPSQMQCCPQYDERALLEDLENLIILWCFTSLNLSTSFLSRMEHLEILQIWKGDTLKIYLEMQRVLDSFLGHIHNNSKTITDHEKMHDHGILVVAHCDVGNELACSCIMYHAFKLSRVIYYASIKEVLANDLEEDSGHENVHVFSCLTNLHLQGLLSLKSISLQALAFRFIKENKVFDCPSLRSYLLSPKLVNNTESRYQRISRSKSKDC
ncbi:hypothetical protein UlMin_016357 [Ulmus minor]